MAKTFGILLFCLGIYVGLELYVEGTQHAFGGVFASATADGEAAGEHRTAPQRAGDAVNRAHAEGRERMERVLPD